MDTREMIDALHADAGDALGWARRGRRRLVEQARAAGGPGLDERKGLVCVVVLLRDMVGDGGRRFGPGCLAAAAKLFRASRSSPGAGRRGRWHAGERPPGRRRREDARRPAVPAGRPCLRRGGRRRPGAVAVPAARRGRGRGGVGRLRAGRGAVRRGDHCRDGRNAVDRRRAGTGPHRGRSPGRAPGPGLGHAAPGGPAAGGRVGARSRAARRGPARRWPNPTSRRVR